MALVLLFIILHLIQSLNASDLDITDTNINISITYNCTCSFNSVEQYVNKSITHFFRDENVKINYYNEPTNNLIKLNIIIRLGTNINLTEFKNYLQNRLNSDFGYNILITINIKNLSTESTDNNNNKQNVAKTLWFEIYKIGIPYIIIALIILIPTFINFIAFCFHQTRPGTDNPSYIALFIFFWSIADFYTDVIWTLTLYNDRKNTNLFLFAFCFTFGSHLISIIVGLTYITIWRQTRSTLHIFDYVLQYNKFLILSTLISGFYSTQRIITSHLFHLNIFSFQLRDKQMKQITNLKIINQIFLENIPCFIIQYLYLITTENDTINTKTIFDIINIDTKTGTNSICLLAMLFSAVQILFWVLRIIVGAFNYFFDTLPGNQNNNWNKICFEFCFKSPVTNVFKKYHIHTKYLLSNAIRLAFHIQISQIEIIQIQQITDGIKVNVILKYLNDINTKQILNGLMRKKNVLYFSFYNECANQLRIHSPKIILNVSQIYFIQKNGTKKDTYVIGNTNNRQHMHTFKHLQESIQLNDIYVD